MEKKPALENLKNLGKTAVAKAATCIDQAAHSLVETGFQTILITDFDPEVNVLDTKGLQVTVQTPVTHTFTPPSLKDRAQQTADNYLKTGKLEIPPTLPRGKKGKKGENTVTHPVTSSTMGQLIVPGVGLRQNILNTIANGYPNGLLQLRASGHTKSMARLRQNGIQTNLETQEAADLNPTIESNYLIFYYNPKGEFCKLEVPFKIGQEPLEIDKNGVIQSIFMVGRKSFHPSLIGLNTFANILSSFIHEQTDRNATVKPSLIEEALILSAHADQDTDKIFQPAIERMLAIDIIDQLLWQKPSELISGLFSVMDFVTPEGNPHPNRHKIRTLIASSATPSLEELPNGITRSRNYLELVKNICAATTPEQAYISWKKDHQLIHLHLERAGSLQQLHNIMRHIDDTGKGTGEKISEETKPSNAIEPRLFLTSSTMPSVLLAGAISHISENQTQAALSVDASRRIIRTSQLIRSVSGELTETHLQYLNDFEQAVLRQLSRVKPLGHQHGRSAGQELITATADNSSISSPR